MERKQNNFFDCDFRRFEEMMNRMFEEFWGRPSTRRLLPSGERGAIVPAEQREPFIDVIEISAETKHEEKKEEKGYIYRERRSGSYYRAISLPSPVDPDRSKAAYKNGVLEVKCPRQRSRRKHLLRSNKNLSYISQILI